MSEERRSVATISPAVHVTKLDGMVNQDPLKAAMDETKPVYHGVAERWTTVTRDDLLVSHLLDLYYTHQHDMITTHDKDAFLQDLSSGQTVFCSPVLVNIILANSAVCVLAARRSFISDFDLSDFHPSY